MHWASHSESAAKHNAPWCGVAGSSPGGLDFFHTVRGPEKVILEASTGLFYLGYHSQLAAPVSRLLLAVTVSERSPHSRKSSRRRWNPLLWSHSSKLCCSGLLHPSSWLLTIEMLPDAEPTDVGRKATVIEVCCPAFTFKGRENPLTG